LSLESAKIKSSSPKERDEFKQANPVTSTNFRFQLSGSFWNALTSEPEIRGEFERMIDDRVKQRLTEDLSVKTEEIRKELLESARAEGYQKGLEQGITEGREHVSMACGQLDEIAKKILADQKSLISSHEKIWCETLSYILKRFLVAKRQWVVEDLRRWLVQSFEASTHDEKIRVYLSNEDHERLSEVLAGSQADEFVWVKDDSLGSGEIRCESTLGTVVFSPDKKLSELDCIIAKYVP
jgi:flagellar biosynthesis/type III secretory pathway protein FliH